jgi:hypothetical protein
MSLEGDLTEFSLIGVMQIICMERRRAGLIVRRRGEEATVLFDSGDVVHASLGSLEGEEALYRLLTWTEGAFRTTDQITIHRRTVWKNWNHLLIEGMRRIDEHKLAAGQPRQGEFSRADAERDSRLENDLMVLLSTLEQAMSHLGDKKIQKRPAMAVELVADLVNRVVAFAETVRPADPAALLLRNVVVQAAATNASVRGLALNGNRLSTDASQYRSNGRRGLFPGPHPDVREIAGAILVLLESYFSQFATMFRSPSESEQWCETYGVFIADLKANLDRVQV